MSIFEKANEMIEQLVGLASLTTSDLIGSLFMRVVMFFIDLLLGF